MRCGIFDRRRQRHRCASCRLLHIRCTGGRPCLGCIARGVVCSEAEASLSQPFIYQSGLCGLRPPPIQSSWLYINAYFQAIGQSNQASVFRSSALIGLSQHDQSVQTTLSIIGSIYIYRNPQLMQVDLRERRRIYSQWVRHKYSLAAELTRPLDKATLTVTLLRALLMSMAELLMDQTGDDWWSWIWQITTHLQIQKISSVVDPGDTFVKSLVNFYYYIGSLGAITRDEPPLDQSEPLTLLHASDIVDGTEKMLYALRKWAALRPRMLLWQSRSKSCRPTGPAEALASIINLQAELKVRGLEMVCEASALQSYVIHDLLGTSNSTAVLSPSLTAPYYYMILAELSQIFQQDSWQLLDCDLPIIPTRLLQDQALQTLSWVEEEARRPGVDAVFCLPLTPFISLEVQTELEKRRLLAFLDQIKDRGFAVAQEYSTEILSEGK